jgi:hypothetical protein
VRDNGCDDDDDDDDVVVVVVVVLGDANGDEALAGCGELLSSSLVNKSNFER